MQIARLVSVLSLVAAVIAVALSGVGAHATPATGKAVLVGVVSQAGHNQLVVQRTGGNVKAALVLVLADPKTVIQNKGQKTLFPQGAEAVFGGVRVQVKGTLRQDGALLASRILIQDPDEEDQED